MTKNTRPKPDWTQRRNVTMPADYVDFIEQVAQDQHKPIYQLVMEAVQLYALYRRPSNGDDHANT